MLKITNHSKRIISILFSIFIYQSLLGQKILYSDKSDSTEFTIYQYPDTVRFVFRFDSLISEEILTINKFIFFTRSHKAVVDLNNLNNIEFYRLNKNGITDSSSDFMCNLKPFSTSHQLSHEIPFIVRTDTIDEFFRRGEYGRLDNLLELHYTESIDNQYEKSTRGQDYSFWCHYDKSIKQIAINNFYYYRIGYNKDKPVDYIIFFRNNKINIRCDKRDKRVDYKDYKIIKIQF